jgi:protein-tyrosine phosphatase
LEFSNAGYDEVPDPYWSGEDGFELVLDLVEDACCALLDFVAADIRER